MSKCSLSAFTTDNCEESIHHPLEINTVELQTCNRSIASHLRTLGVTDRSNSVKESELIAYRVGVFVFPSDYRVCPRHRDILGLHWRAKASCQYPNNSGKAKPYRAASICISRRMLIEKGVLLPVGSGICRKCHEDYLKFVNMIKENESTEMIQTCGESNVNANSEKRLREEETLFPRSPTDAACCSSMDMLEKLDVFEHRLIQRTAELENSISALKYENSQERFKWSDLENTISDQDGKIGEISNILEKQRHVDDVQPLKLFKNISSLDFSNLNERSIKSKRSQFSTTAPAFYAYMSTYEQSPGRHHTLHFDTIITNIGSAYNRYSGIFTPTVSGTYVLSYSIKPYSGAYIPIELVRNTQIIGSAVTHALSSYEHGASSTVVIQLSAGDACFVRTSNSYTPTGHIYSSVYARSSFSGWHLI